MIQEKDTKRNALPSTQKKFSWRPFLTIFAMFVSSICLLFLVFSKFPKLDESEWEHIKVPRSLADAKNLGLVLSRYTDSYYWQVLAGITFIYVFLQSFMIPGSVLFSVLLGYLFPFCTALFIVCFCSAVGASICYLIASLVGGGLIMRFFPDKVKWCQDLTAKYQRHMAIYIFCLRLAPYVPNWVVNITAPILNVPLGHFFVGTFFGVIPLSLLFVNAGTTLQQLTSIGISSLASAYTLPVFTVISLLPFIFRKQLKEKLL